MSYVRIDRVTQGPIGNEEPADRLHIDRTKDLSIYVAADQPGGIAPNGQYLKYINGVPDPATAQPLGPPMPVDGEYRFFLIHYTLRGASRYSFHFADDLGSPNYEDRWEVVTEPDEKSPER